MAQASLAQKRMTLGEMGCGQQFGVPGAGGVCVHICSGAVTPTSPRPLAKT